jgi:hypothetical protein
MTTENPDSLPMHLPKSGVAQTKCSFEYRVEYWSEVTGRRIDSFKDFSHCDLLSRVLISLGEGLFKPSPQICVGPPKIGYFAIERRGHVASQPITPYSRPDSF